VVHELEIDELPMEFCLEKPMADEPEKPMADGLVMPMDVQVMQPVKIGQEDQHLQFPQLPRQYRVRYLRIHRLRALEAMIVLPSSCFLPWPLWELLVFF
jgi:hypothetical protein